jgi:hypothetical protein
MEFQPLYLVRQNFPDRSVKDIPGEVRRQLSAAGFAARLKPGARVAIGVGSRGISNIATIVRAIVDYWKEQGMKPFLFPAMGSHGAATAEGQADVLAHYGIHEATMGCPVVSALDVVSLGVAEQGLEAFMDAAAFASDGIMLVNRVKWHTDFVGKIESGLFKMMAIGVGKFAGAQRYHTIAYTIGLERMVRIVGHQVLRSGKILGGLAILEDAHHNTAMLSAVKVEEMEQREEELLALTKSWMGRIPVDLDILIVNQIGKNFSGAGLDTKVINRSIFAGVNPFTDARKFQRIFLRDLSDLSYGNGVGVGLSDVIHDRLLNKIDWNPTLINSITASTPTAIRTPIHFPTDKECLERIWPTVGKFDPLELTMGWIRNSLEISELAITANLLDEVKRNPELEIVEGPLPWTYDAQGDLVDPLARFSSPKSETVAH